MFSWRSHKENAELTERFSTSENGRLIQDLPAIHPLVKLTVNEGFLAVLDSTVHDNDVYISGFEIVRKDRRVNGRKGGGVCIYLRTNLNYRIRDDLINDDLECLIVEISKPRSSVFLVGTWYRPPNSPLVQFLNSPLSTHPHIGAEPGRAKRRVQDNLHAHAQNKPIKNY